MTNPMMRRLEHNTAQSNPYGFRGKNIKQSRLAGIKDPRGRVGIFARGKNVYLGGSHAAHHKPGYGMGRPPNSAMRRRLKMNKER